MHIYLIQDKLQYKICNVYILNAIQINFFLKKTDKLDKKKVTQINQTSYLSLGQQ